MNVAKYLTAFSVFSVVAGYTLPATAIVMGFQAEYDPTNWTLDRNGGGGFIRTTEPISIFLDGSNTGTGNSIDTDFTITAPNSGTVSFNWDYNTDDGSPRFDPFIRLLNGSETQLTNDGGPDRQSGTDSFLVNTGDSFGFRINTTDDLFGEASTLISNFEAPATSSTQPVPFEVEGAMGFVALGGFLGYRYLRKRKQALNQ